MNPMGAGGRIRKWGPGLAAAGLLALFVVPRFVLLETRPVIHDESLFSYYALIFHDRSHYTHIPMLHGPALMLALGTVFSVFDDTIAVGRAFIAVCSLVALGLLLALAPARTRWWLAPLLATSPVLLYFSRFARNRQNGSFHRFDDALVGSHSTLPKSRCQATCNEILLIAQHLRDTSKYLRQDHTGIASRPHQSPMSYSLGQISQRSVFHCLHLS